jgi:hypothetical protein
MYLLFYLALGLDFDAGIVIMFCRYCGSVLHSTQWDIENALLQPETSSSKVRLA